MQSKEIGTSRVEHERGDPGTRIGRDRRARGERLHLAFAVDANADVAVACGIPDAFGQRDQCLAHPRVGVDTRVQARERTGEGLRESRAHRSPPNNASSVSISCADGRAA